MTTFLHARDNGYKDFWNVDADDIGLYAKPRRIAKLFKKVKSYSNETKSTLMALDLWRTFEFGGHWSFGVVYTNNSTNWLDLMKAHCKDKALRDNYGSVSSQINVDWYCTYLKEIGAAKIETFCVENLRMIHHHNDVYRNPLCGLKYWQGGRCYFQNLSDSFGMGEAGSLTISEDIINFDIGITADESMRQLKRHGTDRFMQIFETVNNLMDAEITIILPLNETAKNIRHCLESLLNQTYTDEQVILQWGPTAKEKLRKIFLAFRLIVTDAGLNEEALKTCREMESQFGERMKIITGAQKADLLSAGLNAAKGRYVLFINGNDIFVPNAFQMFHDIAENTRADVVHLSNYLVPSSDNNFSIKTKESGWGENLQAVTMLQNPRDKFGVWINGMLLPAIYNNFIRREFLEEEKISLTFNTDIAEWLFSLQTLLLSEIYIRLPQPLYMRTVEDDSRKVDFKDFDTTAKSISEGIEILDKLAKEVFYFDEYAQAKNLLNNVYKNLIRKCLNEVLI